MVVFRSRYFLNHSPQTKYMDRFLYVIWMCAYPNKLRHKRELNCYYGRMPIRSVIYRAFSFIWEVRQFLDDRHMAES